MIIWHKIKIYKFCCDSHRKHTYNCIIIVYTLIKTVYYTLIMNYNKIMMCHNDIWVYLGNHYEWNDKSLKVSFFFNYVSFSIELLQMNLMGKLKKYKKILSFSLNEAEHENLWTFEYNLVFIKTREILSPTNFIRKHVKHTINFNMHDVHMSLNHCTFDIHYRKTAKLQKPLHR